MAKVHSINVNPAGGVPKQPVNFAKILIDHVDGDKQRNLKFHGGPMRAVSLLGLDVIEKLRAEGHPISPGSTGENLTIDGLDWPTLSPGMKLRVGEVQLELTSYCRPCKNIRASFLNDDFMRLFQDNHPGCSRLYAKVLRQGVVRVGDEVSVV